MTWPMKPLSELCELAIDCVNKTAPVVEAPTPYKMIRTTNVKGGFIDTETVRYVTKDTFEKWTRRSRPQYGDVILTREAPVGEVGRCTFDDSQNIFLGQRLFQYRPKPELLDWNYLAYALQSPVVQNKLHGVSFGATVPHVKVGDAENLQIPCPELGAQKYIGETLAAYDDLIENNQRRIALLEESAQLLYREWFVNLRFPGHESAAVNEGMPEGWRVSTFGAQVLIRKGKNITKSSVVPGEVPVVAAGLEPMCYHNSANAEGPVVTISASGANAGYVRLYPQNIWASDCSYISNDVTDSLYFFYCALKERQAEILLMQKGAAQPHVYPKDIQAMDLIWPCSKVVKLFQKLTSPLFSLMANLMGQNVQLQQARNALLPKLMSGEIQV